LASPVGEDLWVARRASTDLPWGVPELLPDTVNSAFNDRSPTISPDGHWLSFASDRPGTLGNFDIWVSWRPHVHDDFGWQPAVHLDAPLNSDAFDSGPTLLPDDNSASTLWYFTSGRPGGVGLTDIYVSTWGPDGSFSAPTLVPELSSPAQDQRPYVRHDGLEFFVNSNRAGSFGVFDIWVSTRASTQEPWSIPQNVTVLNTTAQDITPALSWDGRMLIFSSNRPQGSVWRMYVSTRTSSAAGLDRPRPCGLPALGRIAWVHQRMTEHNGRRP
jgi:Tol biopolymer transport system component